MQERYTSTVYRAAGYQGLLGNSFVWESPVLVTWFAILLSQNSRRIRISYEIGHVCWSPFVCFQFCDRKVIKCFKKTFMCCWFDENLKKNKSKLLYNFLTISRYGHILDTVRFRRLRNKVGDLKICFFCLNKLTFELHKGVFIGFSRLKLLLKQAQVDVEFIMLFTGK